MDYYCLKLGTGNSEADLRLKQKPPTAAVYFDDLGEADYIAGKGKGQSRLFWEVGKMSTRAHTIMAVIYQAKIWFLQPASEVRFGHPIAKDGKQFTAKEMNVRVIYEAWCKDVPPVLAGIANSQYHGRRTFTRVGHWGNLKALDYVLGRIDAARAAGEEHWDPPQQGAAQLLECLGSTELETLVGKLFEAKGCHVPAYLGGTLCDIDLFAYNDSATQISIGAITIPPSGRISIQVKTWTEDECPAGVDYFIALNAKTGAKSFDADWLLARVKEVPTVLQWMKRSLRWLPTSFLSAFAI